MIENLPIEIIIEITKYLTHSDIKAIRLVCKKLYTASLDFSFIKKEKLCVHGNIFKKNFETIKSTLLNTSRKYYKWKFTKIEFTNNYDWMFIKMGNWIRHLHLEKCILTENLLININSYCNSLETLILNSCVNLLLIDHIFQNPMNNIKTLHIENTSYITDYIFCKFVHYCPNIENLILRNVNINCHQSVYSFHYNPRIKTPLEQPSNLVFTYNCIRDVLKLKASQIKVLDLSGNYISEIGLSEICQTNNLKLQSLSTVRCREIKPKISINLGTWQPNIKELNLAHCRMVTDAVLTNICKHMINLEILDISYCRNITNNGVKNIGALLKLSKLDMSCLTNINVSNVIDKNNSYKKMSKLIISEIPINTNDVNLIGTSYNNLTELHVDFCDITDNELRIVFKHLKYLRILVLARLELITDRGITGVDVFEQDPSFLLKSMSIKSNEGNINSGRIPDCPLTDKEKILDICNKIDKNYKINCPIDNLKGLKSIDLHKCIGLTKNIFLVGFNFKELTALDLSFTDVTTTSLFILCLKCPLIEYINLSFCNINDVDVQVVVEHLKNLQYLYLQMCIQLTNSSLEAIIEYCKCLKYLDLEGCYNMDSTLIKTILKLPTVISVLCKPNQKLAENTNVPMPPPLPNILP